VVNEPIVFRTENCHKMMNSMSKNDLRDFDFDVRKVNWKQYIEDYYFGSRKNLWNQKSDNYPKLRMKVTRLKYANYLLMGTTAAASLYLLNATRKLLCNKKTQQITPASE
jgi:hypothetical protein